ncbi:TetR/AcrR family transcriptional regulator [Nigerium massiliense]|uniref:TetR/AcrR family transcriptional regulator n=1 Tax=Nigerium massiliense TaxID=1522317 RepID=UPI00058ED064|nr:TetR family transcriptional regulator [Nigerium massiliense]
MPNPDARRRDAATTRARIIDAAIEQLAEGGMRALTHRRVETRAGVTQGLVKYHFGSLDGLIEAVVAHMAAVELDAVVRVTPEQYARAQRTGVLPPEIWRAAEAAWRELTSRPALVRARFELYLHAVDRPELQGLIRSQRQRFLDAAAASLPEGTPQAGARLVLALVNGLLLHQLSAPDADLDADAPGLLLAAGWTAAHLPNLRDEAPG